MSMQTDKARWSILKALDDTGGHAGAAQLARAMGGMGVNLRPRTVRHYLRLLDEEGLTSLVSRRRGRVITDRGREELAHAHVIEKVGFIDAKVDALAYQTSFDLASGQGAIVINTAMIRAHELPRALAQMERAFASGLGMGDRLAIAPTGQTLGGMDVPGDSVAIATVCSVTVNGILLKAGIPVSSRFGGLLEMRDRRPVRFVELIEYRGTTLDPLEAFIAARRTRVRDCALTGSGIIGASFREVPAIAADRVRSIHRQMERAGLGCILAIGQPNQPLLDIPVAEGRAGMIVVGGLNPVAAIHESGTLFPLRSLAATEDFSRFSPYQEICRRHLWVNRPRSRITE